MRRCSCSGLVAAFVAGVIRQIEDGFPYLPAGCKIQLDRVAESLIVDDLKRTIGGTFATFLRETGVALDELYRSPGWTWTSLRRAAGLPTAASGPQEDQLSKALPRLLHMDEGSRLAALRRVLGQELVPSTAAFQELERRILLGLHFTLWGSTSGLSSLADGAALHQSSRARDEHSVIRAANREGWQPADYVSHEKERPVSFVWRLRRSMPADFFKEVKVAAG